MRLNYLTIKDGKPRIIWPALLAFVVAIDAIVIATAEVFWFVLTGGFNTLIGGSALMTATLIVIRVVGATMTMPTYQLEDHLRSVKP
jgi:hypothetical protein